MISFVGEPLISNAGKMPALLYSIFIPPQQGRDRDCTRRTLFLLLCLIYSPSKSFIKICGGSAFVPTPDQSGQPRGDCPYLNCITHSDVLYRPYFSYKPGFFASV